MLKYNEKCLYCGEPLESKNTRKTFCNKKCATYFKRRGTGYIDVPQPKVKTILVNEFTDERLVIYRFLDEMIDSNPLFIEKLRALCKSPVVIATPIQQISVVAQPEKTMSVNEYKAALRELPNDDTDGYERLIYKIDTDQNLTAKQKSMAKSL